MSGHLGAASSGCERASSDGFVPELHRNAHGLSQRRRKIWRARSHERHAGDQLQAKAPGSISRTEDSIATRTASPARSGDEPNQSEGRGVRVMEGEARGPEYIPTPEQRRRNREMARKGASSKGSRAKDSDGDEKSFVAASEAPGEPSEETETASASLLDNYRRRRANISGTTRTRFRTACR